MGQEVPQDSHNVDVDNTDNTSNCVPSTSHNYLLESAKGVISLESSMIQDVTDGCASVTRQGSSSSNYTSQISTYIQDLTNASTSSQRSIDLLSDDMKKIKTILNVRELKEFQVQSINAIQQGSDVILVQPTG